MFVLNEKRKKNQESLESRQLIQFKIENGKEMKKRNLFSYFILHKTPLFVYEIYIQMNVYMYVCVCILLSN